MCSKPLLIWIVCALSLSGCGGGGGSSSGAETANAGPAQIPSNPTDPTPPISDPINDVTQINLLALYTSGVADQFNDPDLRIQHLVAVANDVLSANGVSLTFSAVHVEQVAYPDSLPITQALDDLTAGSHDSFAHITSLRDSTQADLVVLFRPYANDGHCGYAWIGGFQSNGDLSGVAASEFGYSVVASNCSDYTLLHELGHNMGLAHSRRLAPQGGTYEYSVGYGVDNDFVTIMASPEEYNAAQLPRLSSPLLDCNGQPCGVVHTAADGADALRSLNSVKDQVAAFR